MLFVENVFNRNIQNASMFLLIRYIYSDVTGWALSIKKDARKQIHG